jgi:hypothetical protein
MPVPGWRAVTERIRCDGNDLNLVGGRIGRPPFLLKLETCDEVARRRRSIGSNPRGKACLQRKLRAATDTYI